MNNYCTNCGEKLETNAVKCNQCNTYVVDLKVINKKKIFCTIGIFIIILILGIITTIICYNLYYKNLGKSLYEKYLKADYKDAQYVKYGSCRVCEDSCEGSCLQYATIIGCFRYYYKSDTNIKNPDIVIFYNKGDVSIDAYSSIANKYGFNSDYISENEDDMYQVERRSELRINVDYIDSNSIVKIYKMVNEIIDIYKKDNKNSLYIAIYSHNNSFYISNVNTNNKSSFEWVFGYDIQLLNPTLDDVKKIYNQADNKFNSSDEEYYYND